MTEIDTDKLAKMHAEATPGPWVYDPDKSSFVQTANNLADIAEIDGWPIEYRAEEIANGSIIAYLRSNVPAILAMAEENKRLREALEPRSFDAWSEDFSDVLWHLIPIAEAPFCGTPHDSTWPYHGDDEPRLWWTPLPDCNEIQARCESRCAIGEDTA